MILTPKISHCYLNTNQSEEWTRAYHTLMTSSLTLPLKTLPWNLLVFCSGLLTWAACAPCLAPCWAPWNKCTFLHHNPVSIYWLYLSWASRPRFASVTILAPTMGQKSQVSIFPVSYQSRADGGSWIPAAWAPLSQAQPQVPPTDQVSLAPDAFNSVMKETRLWFWSLC